MYRLSTKPSSFDSRAFELRAIVTGTYFLRKVTENKGTHPEITFDFRDASLKLIREASSRIAFGLPPSCRGRDLTVPPLLSGRPLSGAFGQSTTS
jgi:hypothetical protein